MTADPVAARAATDDDLDVVAGLAAQARDEATTRRGGPELVASRPGPDPRTWGATVIVGTSSLPNWPTRAVMVSGWPALSLVEPGVTCMLRRAGKR